MVFVIYFLVTIVALLCHPVRAGPKDALWAQTTHVTKVIQKPGELERKVTGWTCNHCKSTFWNTDASRMIFHMGGDTALRNQYFSSCEVCPDVPDTISTIAKSKMATKANEKSMKGWSCATKQKSTMSIGGVSASSGARRARTLLTAAK